MRLITQILITLSLIGSTIYSAQAEDDNRDSIFRADGKTVRAYIVRETITDLIYTSKLDGGSEQAIRWKDVTRFEYNAMLSSLWTGPQQFILDGDYPSAIKQLSGLARLNKEGDVWAVIDNEDSKWDQVLAWKRAYGLFYLGHTLELSGQRAEAAQVFNLLTAKMPDHRLSMYAVYREGINLALSGGSAKAALEAIKKFTTTDAGALASDLERALMVVDMSVTDFAKAERESGRLKTRFREDLEDWIYWRELWASILLEKKEFDKALSIYEEVYDKMAGNPKRRARAALLTARALEKAGKADDAILYYLQLDVLPLVGLADLAEARFRAAQLYLVRLESLEPKEKDRIGGMIKGLLGAVVKYAPAGSDLIIEAQTIIDEQFGVTKEAAAEEEPAEGEAPAE